eukprot:gene30353-35358_t
MLHPSRAPTSFSIQIYAPCAGSICHDPTFMMPRSILIDNGFCMNRVWRGDWQETLFFQSPSAQRQLIALDSYYLYYQPDNFPGGMDMYGQQQQQQQQQLASLLHGLNAMAQGSGNGAANNQDLSQMMLQQNLASADGNWAMNQANGQGYAANGHAGMASGYSGYAGMDPTAGASGVSAAGGASDPATQQAAQQMNTMMPGMSPQQLQAMYQQYALRFAAMQQHQSMGGPTGGPGAGGGGLSGVPVVGPRSGSRDQDKAGLFYKTRVCIKWKEGSCAYGNNCRYAHGEEDLRVPSNAANGNRAGPTPDKRLLINMMKKTRLCQDFMQTGNCRYGEKCTFAHGQHELRTPPDLRNTGQAHPMGPGPNGWGGGPAPMDQSALMLQ